MKGMLFDIQKFSTHDGPGLRTTVFFKGCSLSCAWCHNPESIHAGKEIQIHPHHCIGCGACMTECDCDAHRIIDGQKIYDAASCVQCGRCAAACYPGAIEMAGYEVTVDEIMAEILLDEAFIKSSDGGVTLSGGEPLLQSAFAARLLQALKARGFHTAVDTAGHVPYGAFQDVLASTDLFLYDIKTMDDALHRQFIHAGNERILSNLRQLDRDHPAIHIRVPVIPTFNADVQSIQQIMDFIYTLDHVHKVQLLPYHFLGSGKYDALQKPYPLQDIQPPSKALMAQLNALVDGRYR